MPISGETYQTESFVKVRRAFSRARTYGYAYCIDGPPGTQKTFSLKSLCAETQNADGDSRRAIYVRCRTRMSRRDLLTEISTASGIPARGCIGAMIRKLRHYFSDHRVVLVIDEGQQLDNDALETLRELLDEPPHFGLLFAGSHDLHRKFVQIRLEQWRSRLQTIIELRGLTEEEVRTIWTKEVGPLSEKKFKELVERCRVLDCRRRDATYLSARNLFFAIEGVKQQE
jgi:type II secretory pathway predicted ATPase ExeA